MRVQLSTDLVTASASGRTIAGRIVTFGEVGQTSAGPAMFLPGSITAPTQVVLMNEHDTTAPLGKSIELRETPDRMDAVFRIIRTSRGDDAIVEASEGVRSGFSVGVDVIDHEMRDGVLTVLASTLDHVGLVTRPAIASALVDSVAAAQTITTVTVEESTETSTTTETQTIEGDPMSNDTATPAAAAASAPLPEAVTATAPAYTPVAVVSDGFPYHSQATDRSYFRDMLNASHNQDAAGRVNVAQRLIAAAGDPTTRATNPTVIPPGYRPDLYVGEIMQGAPTVSAFASYPISDATPFKVPTFTSGTDLSVDNSEGTNPISGSIATSEVTVSPKAVSGIWNVSREALDAANPAIDMIGMSAMREEYTRDLETYVAGIFVAGASAGTPGATTKYQTAVIKNFAAFVVARYAPAEVFLVGANLYTWLAGEMDTAGRALNPFITPVNSFGQTGVAVGSIAVAGVPVTAAPAVGTALGLLGRRADAASFVSPVLSWRFDEKVGPGLIQFAQWGYTGAAVLRSAGLYKYTQTV